MCSVLHSYNWSDKWTCFDLKIWVCICSTLWIPTYSSCRNPCCSLSCTLNFFLPWILHFSPCVQALPPVPLWTLCYSSLDPAIPSNLYLSLNTTLCCRICHPLSRMLLWPAASFHCCCWTALGSFPHNSVNHWVRFGSLNCLCPFYSSSLRKRTFL